MSHKRLNLIQSREASALITGEAASVSSEVMHFQELLTVIEVLLLFFILL